MVVGRDGRMIVPLPEELSRKLLAFMPASLPDEEPLVGGEDVRNRLSPYLNQECGLQRQAVNEYRGIFKIYTGAGKTIALMEGIRRPNASLRTDRKDGRPTERVVCSTQVFDKQWDGEVRDYRFARPPLACGNFAGRANPLERVLNNQERIPNNLLLVITTHALFTDQIFAWALNASRVVSRVTGLLIEDEMHRARTTDVANRHKGLGSSSTGTRPSFFGRKGERMA